MRRIDIIWDNPKRAEDLKGTVRIFEGKEKTASCVYSLADTYYRGINAQPNVHCWEEL